MAEPASQRLFFALWPGPSVRERLACLAREAAGRGRVPHPDDMHITLAFLGEVSADRLDCVLGVADHLRAAPLELSIERLGFWPRPRILWCGPSETPPALLALVGDLYQGLRACGFEPEHRTFQAHCTLARKARDAGELRLAEPFRWPVSEVVLALSEAVAAPPRYHILRRWPLVA